MPKIIGCLLLAVCLLVPCAILPCAATTLEVSPAVSAQSAVLIEADSAEIAFAKAADFPLPMASTTKIMTALVALELAEPTTELTVSAEAVGIEGSSIYLTEGETLTLEQLLYALLLESANDAATAIAVGLSGNMEVFAAEMNRKAAELGLRQTHFTNPHGLDDSEHFTTAYELALIARAALQNDLFRQIVSTRKTTIPHASTNGSRLLVNHNKLLRLYDGCIGVKTGFTKKSGRCLVSAAERDGVTLIAVTLNAPDDWDDHTKMLDYGFSRYESVLLCEGESLLTPLSVVGGEDNYVMVCNVDALRVTLPTGHGAITKTVELPRFVYAPMRNGEPVGRVVFRCDVNGDGIKETV
ncbi:MAG: D-alanyl-D-alanine carboxypeptidase, partial [Clostridia bacterium]|nr:D-alanyl-D-alanine carboxypeptidase [Clostridia bacterium]